jgi:glutamine amidotransferase-like uncharacterized protein
MSERWVAIYHDEGTGEFTRGCLTLALANAFAGRARVRRIDASEICGSDDWHARTLLLAIPGGADLPYCARLNGAGNASIRRYVEAGGAFLGVCAGAYYACARLAFEASAPGAITGTRELALFAGTARGSLHELAAPYALDHLHCAAVTPVFAPRTGRTLHALYWGGPEFIPDDGARYEPVLHYADALEHRALAAVTTELGRGRIVLTGVHAEVTGAQFPIEVSRFEADSFEHGMRISAQLAAVEAERQVVFDLLIAELGL